MMLNSYHPISRLGLSERMLQRLSDAGFSKIGGLRKATRQTLERIEMIEDTRIEQIKTALAEANCPNPNL